eukprot:g54897.t1
MRNYERNARATGILRGNCGIAAGTHDPDTRLKRCTFRGYGASSSNTISDFTGVTGYNRVIQYQTSRGLRGSNKNNMISDFTGTADVIEHYNTGLLGNRGTSRPTRPKTLYHFRFQQAMTSDNITSGFCLFSDFGGFITHIFGGNGVIGAKNGDNQRD